MTDGPKLSVVIPWFDRGELKATLCRNASQLCGCDTEILVINCGGDSDLLYRQLRESLVSSACVRQLNVPTAVFNKALALNLGVGFSQGSLIFMLDCDILLGPGFIAEAMISIDGSSFVTVAAVHESRPSVVPELRPDLNGRITSVTRINELRFSFADGSTICHQTLRRNLFNDARAGQGLVIVTKDNFNKINGYNSEHTGWGWEDTDFQIRLKHCLGLRHLELGEATHLSHDDRKRALFGKSRSRSSMGNLSASLQRYANQDFSGTYLADLAVWRDQISERSI